MRGKRTELYVCDAEPEKVSFALKKACILRPVVTKGNDTVLMDNYRIYLENNIKNLCLLKTSCGIMGSSPDQFYKGGCLKAQGQTAKNDVSAAFARGRGPTSRARNTLRIISIQRRYPK